MKLPSTVSTQVSQEHLQLANGLENFLQARIIGQENIVANLSNCLKYGWCDLSTPGRPRGTLFLLGPTGVGKTESIRAAVEYLYGEADRNLLRLDRNTGRKRCRAHGNVSGTALRGGHSLR